MKTSRVLELPKKSADSARDEKWPVMPGATPLESGDVHVWRAALDVDAPRLAALESTLDETERRRAARFRFERDRKRFIAAHGILRAILSRYLAIEPSRLSFSCGPWGKPALVGEGHSDDIRFSMSHSHGLALYAVAQDRDVGIDIECSGAECACEQLAESFFSSREVREIQALPERKRPEAFFCCWTRKEAYLKARGLGLALPLDKFHVSAASTRPDGLVEVTSGTAQAPPWYVRGLLPAAGFVAALATQGRRWTLRCWQWPHPPDA